MPHKRYARFVVAAALALLGACGRSPAPPSSSGNEAMQEATLRTGDVVVRANAMPTQSLGDAVARQYGIERDDKTVLLLVGVRRGTDAQETALPARIDATATDLMGHRQDIALREVRSGDFIDYVGTARVIPPDTLRFELQIALEGKSWGTLRFNRDFFPQR